METAAHVLTPDAQAIFLLCGRFGKHESDRSAKPLTLTEYNEVATWLYKRALSPAALLGNAEEELKDFPGNKKLNAHRITQLLQRGASMAMAVEEWTNQGGWILARSDDAYPKRLKDRLRHKAPPILYGIGPKELLERGGVGMVGSRDADDAALSFVKELARRCAEEGIQVVSGGARGVDRVSMEAALEAGGTVAGALANGLAKKATSKRYRSAVTDGRLVLVSAYHPNSRFQVWKAMDRNKHVYALSDVTLVAHSAVESGGTWAGATENLRHEWVPVAIRHGKNLLEGNRQLIDRGGIPVDNQLLRENYDLKDWVNRPVSLVGSSENESDETAKKELSSEGKTLNVSNADGSSPQARRVREALNKNTESELYPFVWPAIAAYLTEPRSERDVKNFFSDLRLTQGRDWLKEAVERGDAERTENPVRYSLPEELDDQDNASRQHSSQAVRGDQAEKSPGLFS